jgi:hypothetical protein
MGLLRYDADDIIQAINASRPLVLANEKGYEEALYKYLHDKRPYAVGLAA